MRRTMPLPLPLPLPLPALAAAMLACAVLQLLPHQCASDENPFEPLLMAAERNDARAIKMLAGNYGAFLPLYSLPVPHTLT